jgi:antitoxin PrlF
MPDIATLTSKSQLTLPKAIREALGVGPGDQIRFVPSLNGFRIVAINGDITQFRGAFKGKGSKTVTVDEMNRAVAEGAARRHMRSSGMRSR